jgi:hypothetical protein
VGLDECEHLLGEVLGGVEVAVFEYAAGEDREQALDLWGTTERKVPSLSSFWVAAG